MSAMDVTKYKPKAWTKYFVDGPVEVEICERDPSVNIEYEECGSLRACPDDVLSGSVNVEDDDRIINFIRHTYMEDFKPSRHIYSIVVYNKITKKKLIFEVNEDDMEAF